MQTFYHHRLQGLENFITEVRKVNGYYLGRNPDLPDAAARTLQQLQAFLERENLQDGAGKISGLLGEVETVRRGMHPVTFEKLEIPKREMQYALTFKSVEAANELLITTYQQATAHISAARELVENILLVAIQNNLLRLEDLPKSISQKQLKAIWESLGRQDALAVIQKKALLQVHIADCLLILDEAFARMRTKAGRRKGTVLQ